jgi:membrane fusion protein, multidrug efflux system
VYEDPPVAAKGKRGCLVLQRLIKWQHPNPVRYVIPIVLLVALIGGLTGVKVTQISSLINMGKQMQKAGPPPEVVSTAMSEAAVWGGALSAVGSVMAAKGVSISNDAPGVVARISFDSGAQVKAGQVLVELDASVERAELASAVARRDLAALTANRSRALVASNSLSQSQLDADEAQLRTATTDAAGLQAQIDRKIVRAPFSGRLGIRAVNLGQYLNAGTTLTVLEAIDLVYVDFTLPQQRLSDIKVGMPVKVTIEGAAGLSSDGVIAAVDPEIDSTTRTLKLRASVPNKEEKLRPGMFANVSVVLPERGSIVTIPATAVVHAPFGDSVFVVEDKKDDAGAVVKGEDDKPVRVARQQFVRLGEARGDFVAIQDGVTAGQELVSAGAFKLRNGSSIKVIPDVKAAPSLNPHPDNR